MTCPPGQIGVGGACQDRPGNHYTCECGCTGFGGGARVAPTATINVYDDPSTQNVVGLSAPANQGTIAGTSRQAVINGVDQTWWFVNFDAGPNGWVVQSDISVVTGVPLFTVDKDVCVTAVENPNLPGGHLPTPAELTADCSTDRVAPFFAAGHPFPPGATCGCAVTVGLTDWVAECDAPCTDPSNICLVSGSDPNPPTPDGLSTALFSTVSVCQVTSGTATLTVTASDGPHQPKKQPTLHGQMQIHGRPCPGGGCMVGLAYQFTADPIEFDSGTIFASDPKFVDISMSGATQPDSIALGELLGFEVGSIDPGTALTSVNGRRSGSAQRIVALVQNSETVAFAVNWTNNTCRLSGQQIHGQIIGDNGETLDITADVAVDGVIVNQPPAVSAGRDQRLECTSPTGTPVTLDASATTDPDNNLSFYIWRQGSDTGPLVGDPSANPVRHTKQTLGTKTYFVRAVDTALASDTSSLKVSVVDTTAPAISCNAPATISPPDAPVSFKATATDTCSASAPAVVIDNVQCLNVNPSNGTTDTSKSCKVTAQGDTIIVNNTGGVNGIIQWSAHATDASGNVAQRTCQVSVVSQGKTK